MGNSRKFFQYFKEYKWSNIFAMVKNSGSSPKICTEDFKNRVVVITGATSGIGYHTARKYASMGADILAVNRNEQKSQALCKEITSEFGVNCNYKIADLSSLTEIKRVAEELATMDSPIDVLIHNAGIYLTKKELTVDGLEKLFVVHYLSTFIINYRLREKLKSQEKARIIMVGSEGHRFAAWGLRLDDLNWEKRRYSGLKSYGSAKTSQLLSMIIFDEDFQNSGVTINTMHPGAVKTETGQENGALYRWFKRNFFDKTLKSPQLSAEALYYLGVSRDIEGVGGKFFSLTTQEEPAPPALDKEVAAQLWDISLELNDMNLQENIYDTIVVGGGIAGLTSAAYLSRAGERVLLIEKNRELGGLVNSFTHNGFHFEAGVRALEDAGIIFPMLKELKIDLEVVKSPVSLGIENEIIDINTVADLQKYRELLVKFFPESDGEIDDVLKIIKKIMKHMEVLYGIENPVFKDLKRDREFIFKKLLPWLPKFIFTVGKINRMNMPVEDYLKTVVKNPALNDIISQHFFKNTPAFFALSYFSLYLDYFYPKGGVNKLCDALKNKILENGGEIKTETKIIEVLPGGSLLKDQNYVDYKYRNLIWAADLKTFYNILDVQGVEDKVKTKLEETKIKMLKNRGCDSVFSLFLEIDEPLESFGKIANGHFFYTPSKLGLGETHRSELDLLIRNFESVKKEQVLTWLDKFTKLNTYEISIPGLKDSQLVPEGKTGMIISFLAEYDLFKKIQTAGWLSEFVQELENRIIDVISQSVYPMLKDKIIERFSFSPLSIESRVGSSEGSIVGWSFEKIMPVVNKIQISDRSVFTPVPSIFQAGQWAYSPAGVPMSILTGRLAADKIIKSVKKRG
ncbi:MAG: SDR family NAD(P)-dependent oxidoreductase [Bacteroidales bacterium]|nr:SDR family NAD(P)-dependent oxidoreductase [Bacteroidales bacterium]